MIIEIDRYCRRTGTIPTALCKVAVGHSNLWHKLRAGAELHDETIAKLRQAMAENPDGIHHKRGHKFR